MSPKDLVSAGGVCPCSANNCVGSLLLRVGVLGWRSPELLRNLTPHRDTDTGSNTYPLACADARHGARHSVGIFPRHPRNRPVRHPRTGWRNHHTTGRVNPACARCGASHVLRKRPNFPRKIRSHTERNRRRSHQQEDCSGGPCLGYLPRHLCVKNPSGGIPGTPLRVGGAVPFPDEDFRGLHSGEIRLPELLQGMAQQPGDIPEGRASILFMVDVVEQIGAQFCDHQGVAKILNYWLLNRLDSGHGRTVAFPLARVNPSAYTVSPWSAHAAGAPAKNPTGAPSARRFANTGKPKASGYGKWPARSKCQPRSYRIWNWGADHDKETKPVPCLSCSV